MRSENHPSSFSSDAYMSNHPTPTPTPTKDVKQPVGKIEFKCPKCGGHKIIETMVDMVVHSEISISEQEVDETGPGGIFTNYGDQTNEDGHVDRYQCADCGFVIVDGDSPHADDGLDADALAKALKQLAEPPKKGDSVSPEELALRIALQYETLSVEELAAAWNELFPEQVVCEDDLLFWVAE